ncbi:MAG: hypothetical protein ACO3J3_00215 [Candidatus Nanopelagicales bacterium]
MSVTLEGDPGCSALGHLYRADGAARACITCGYVEPSPSATAAEGDASDEKDD